MTPKPKGLIIPTAKVYNFHDQIYPLNSMWIWEQEEIWKINNKNIEQLIQKVS